MFKKKINKPGQGNGGSGNVGGAKGIVEKGKDVKRTESRISGSVRGQASSSPMSEDGNDKELLNRICQLHRQIRVDHIPAKDIVSAIGELKTEIQDLISELADPEENTEATPKSVKSKHGEHKTTASGTTNSNDLYTVATTTRNKFWKLNSDLVKTRKELKDISELAVAVGQEVGFQPEKSRADKEKDSLNINANRALEDIKRMNKELSEKLNKLSKNIEGYSTNQTEQQRNDQQPQPNRPYQKPETSKQPKKKKEQSAEKKDHKSSQFDTNLEIISKAVSSFDDLQQYKGQMDPLVQRTILLCMGKEDNLSKDKPVFFQLERAVKYIDVDLKEFRHLKSEYRELKEIRELAVAVGQEVGFMPSTSNAGKDKDSLSVNAKEALEDIKQRNRTLSEELNKLSKNIESSSTDQTEQQSKQSNDKKKTPIGSRQQHSQQTTKGKNDQPDVKRDHKSSQVDTNLEIISKVASRFDDLQKYKRQMDPLVQSTLLLCMGKEDNLSKDESVFLQLERAVKYIDVDLKEFRHLKSEYSKMVQLAKRTIELAMKKGDQPIQDNTLLSQLERAIGDIEGDIKKLGHLETKNSNMDQLAKRTIELAMKEGDQPIQDNTLLSQLERAIGNIEGDIEKLRHLETKNSKMDHLAKRTIELAMKEGHQPIQDKTLLSQLKRAIEDIEVDFKKLRHLETKNSTYEQMLKYVWKTTNAAAIHVKELTSNNKGPGKFQIVKVGEVQSDEIDQFNQLVVNMIKAIEGLVERDTRSGDEIQKLKREIERKVKENEVLHNRLSKLAGNKMTEGNPNIANLGDPNRPTKIAEVYSEIYDNEWTDTLDVCLKKLGKEYSEDEALQALNKTLIICYKICQEKSDEWIQKTKEVLNKWLADLMVDIQSDEILMQIIQGRKVDPDKRSQQLLKDIRPKKDLVATKYAKEMNSSKLYKMIIQNKFFEKCFTLCWKMIVQNPRMILVEGPSKGEKYDRNIFREFTSSGSKVVFTVWPALYLHKDGPLLVKGVVKVE